MAQLLMPKLSDTMEEGTILQWLVADGEAVAKGQPLVEIETDKANMTVEAPEDGTLHVIAAEGDTLRRGRAHRRDRGGRRRRPRRRPRRPSPRPGRGGGRGRRERCGEEDRTDIPIADDGTAAEIGVELGSEETYPGARAADGAEAEEAAEAAEAAEALQDLDPERPAPRPRERRAHEGLAPRPAPGRRARRGHRDGARHRPGRPDRARRRRGRRARGRGVGEGGGPGRARPPRRARRRLPARRRPRRPRPGERVPLTRLQRTVAAAHDRVHDRGAAVRAPARRRRHRAPRPAPPARGGGGRGRGAERQRPDRAGRRAWPPPSGRRRSAASTATPWCARPASTSASRWPWTAGCSCPSCATPTPRGWGRIAARDARSGGALPRRQHHAAGARGQRRSRSPTWACSASTASRPSSTRPRPAILAVGRAAPRRRGPRRRRGRRAGRHDAHAVGRPPRGLRAPTAPSSSAASPSCWSGPGALVL